MAFQEYSRIQISPQDSVQHAIQVIEAGASQIALVVDHGGRLVGTVTDGDIRRGILRGIGLAQAVSAVMNTHPVTAPIDASRPELLALMASCSIRQVPLVDGEGRVVGLERLDQLLGKPSLKGNPVIILAGGRGTRLQPLTSHTPKALLRIGGRPVLELMVQQLRSQGFRQIYISLNYLGDQIKEYFGDGRGLEVSIQYLIEPEPLGTAGPIGLLPRPVDMPCVVVNGDLVTKVNFEHMLQFHREGGFALTAGVKEFSLQLPFGVVVTDGEQVVGFHEKPTEKRLINSGVYVVEPDILEMVPPNTYYDMNQLIEKLLDHPRRPVGAFVIHEYWMDIGTPADYQRAQWDYFANYNDR